MAELGFEPMSQIPESPLLTILYQELVDTESCLIRLDHLFWIGPYLHKGDV